MTFARQETWHGVGTFWSYKSSMFLRKNYWNIPDIGKTTLCMHKLDCGSILAFQPPYKTQSWYTCMKTNKQSFLHDIVSVDQFSKRAYTAYFLT